MQKYFILDCFGQVCGNPKGYPTFKGAEVQQNYRKSKAYKQLVRAYNIMERINPENNLFSKIELRTI